jgi:hypothetical protein
MARIPYIEKKFSPQSLVTIAHAIKICEEYKQQGYDLTLRQLYYQFVSRDLIANRDSEYKRLGSIINDARLGGYLDWDYIVDRTRNVRSSAHWDDSSDMIKQAARQFKIDKWRRQLTRIEVWIEKDALVGVLEACCPGEDVSYFSCRGYTSQSEVWGAAQRLRAYLEAGQGVRIIHLGDHDPSGIDMTRDIEERLATFLAQDFNGCPIGLQPQDYVSDLEHLFAVERIALNWDQIQQYDPPPNPAKLTDARARGYIDRFGSSSWELDALEPTVLVGLIRRAIEDYRDDEVWNEDREEEEKHREMLTSVSDRWDEVKGMLA